MKPGYTPALRRALTHGNGVDLFAQICMKPHRDIYVFDLFTPAFCAKLLEEADRHKSRPPNSMNRYGKVLEDIGLYEFEKQLLDEVVNPLAQDLFGYYMRGHYGFLVEYAPKKQRALALHEDESLVTLNVCLGRKFKGGAIAFKDPKSSATLGLSLVDHAVGQAILHLGRHQHKALPVVSGRRTNLILWCKKGVY